VTSFLAFLAVAGLITLLLWAANKLEPTWVSRDGQRLMCMIQPRTNMNVPLGRWRESRVTRVGDMVQVRPRTGTFTTESDRDVVANDTTGFGALGLNLGLNPRSLVNRRPKVTNWRVIGRSTTDTLKNKVVYLLEGSLEDKTPAMLAIRLKQNSKAIPMLESIAMQPLVPRDDDAGAISDEVSSPPDRGTPRSDPRPDRR
jgi:hypothetical protein